MKNKTFSVSGGAMGAPPPAGSVKSIVFRRFPATTDAIMLGTFPEVFSQAPTSQGYFRSSNFPNLQFSRRLLPKTVLTAALGPLANPSPSGASEGLA